MVFLSGPRRGVGRVKLHDPPPGYHPPRPRPSIPLKDRQRLAREYLITMRVATVVLVFAAAAFIVIIFVIIATH
jgi:hypothetical protein